jgi:hypothetical protein
VFAGAEGGDGEGGVGVARGEDGDGVAVAGKEGLEARVGFGDASGGGFGGEAVGENVGEGDGADAGVGFEERGEGAGEGAGTEDADFDGFPGEAGR